MGLIGDGMHINYAISVLPGKLNIITEGTSEQFARQNSKSKTTEATGVTEADKPITFLTFVNLLQAIFAALKILWDESNEVRWHVCG